MVRAAAIAPEPIASFRAVDVRGSETHTGGCAGAARSNVLLVGRWALATIDTRAAVDEDLDLLSSFLAWRLTKAVSLR
jgi:hypothetical protein